MSHAPEPILSHALSSEEVAHADHASRIAAMLERWAAEDCSDEPEWDVDEIAPLRFQVSLVESEGGDAK